MSKNPQRSGDCFQIDLAKERIIAGFDEIDIERDNQVPAKYTLKLLDKNGDRARDDVSGIARVKRKFPPTKVQYIEIMVSEPTVNNNGEPYLWKIFGFELVEVMLFGHFIKRKI